MQIPSDQLPNETIKIVFCFVRFYGSRNSGHRQTSWHFSSIFQFSSSFSHIITRRSNSGRRRRRRSEWNVFVDQSICFRCIRLHFLMVELNESGKSREIRQQRVDNSCAFFCRSIRVQRTSIDFRFGTQFIRHTENNSDAVQIHAAIERRPPKTKTREFRVMLSPQYEWTQRCTTFMRCAKLKTNWKMQKPKNKCEEQR